MADYDIFREQLAIKYPSYGHALWEPSPWKPDRPVQVGDVGFIRNGRFHSLFNALRPAEGQSNVPEYYEQLCPSFSDHISKSSLSSNHYCSAGISVEPEPDYHASSPDDFRQASFRHPRRRGGAVLSLPVKARREDTLAKGDFGAWIVKHIDRWFAFARGLGLGIEQMEEIILVTGCDHTRSWTNVAFLGSEYNAQATFGFKVDHSPAINIEWQSSPEHVQGAVLHRGPDGTNLPEDQCVFIRGFRVARTFRILPKQLKAAAGPSPDLDGYNFEPDIEVVSIPATAKYRDPLHTILDYIAERAPDCDRLLIHDDDLKRINGIGDGTSLETLQPDVVMDLLRESNVLDIHAVHCDLSHTSSNPKSKTEVVRVAMFSVQNWKIALQSQPSSLAAQSTNLLHTIESQASQSQTLPDSFLVPVDTQSSSSPSLLPPSATQLGGGVFHPAPPTHDRLRSSKSLSLSPRGLSHPSPFLQLKPKYPKTTSSSSRPHSLFSPDPVVPAKSKYPKSTTRASSRNLQSSRVVIDLTISPSPSPSPPPSSPARPSSPSSPERPSPNVIDLTSSPSPPPTPLPSSSTLPQPPQYSSAEHTTFWSALPKTSVCIGRLDVTAIIVYPSAYLDISPSEQSGSEPVWGPVTLQYKRSLNLPGSEDTVCIMTPDKSSPQGGIHTGEDFAILERRAASVLGPMLGKGHIRVDSKIRRGNRHLPTLPLEIVVHTPKADIAVVGNALLQSGLLLDDPWKFPIFIPTHILYHNPHKTLSGGHARALMEDEMRQRQEGAGREQDGTDKADEAWRYRRLKRRRSMSRESI